MQKPARLRVASKLPHASGSRINAFRRGWYFEGYARWVKYPRLSRGIFILSGDQERSAQQVYFAYLISLKMTILYFYDCSI